VPAAVTVPMPMVSPGLGHRSGRDRESAGPESDEKGLLQIHVTK
jgi:hypothetical protein